MNHTATLTPLTPIHIGTGETIEPYEYVITDRLYKFRPEEFVAGLDAREQERFLKLAGHDPIVMREFVRNRFKNIKPDIEYKADVHPTALKVYEERLRNIKSDLSISPCIKSGGAPYIPGSSLKGAIRTAVLYNRVEVPVTERDARKLEAETFGYDIRRRNGSYQRPDMTRDPFKFLKVGDSNKVKKSSRLETVTVHTKRDEGWSEEMTMLREITLSTLTTPKHAPEFKLTLTTRNDPATGKTPFSVRRLIKDCNNFYYLHLRREMEFLAGIPDAQGWYNALDKIYEKLPENSCLIRFGWGTGFDGVTINYAKEPKEIKKSRRLTADFAPLGWAELRIYG